MSQSVTPRATLPHALNSEWTKLTSLWSSRITLLTMVVMIVGMGILTSANSADEYRTGTQAARQEFYPMGELFLLPVLIGQLAVVVLGVLVITSEYATGMIRPSLAAVPRRGRLLVAKGAVFAAVTLAAGLVIGFALFFVTQSILATGDAPSRTLGDPYVLRSVVGVSLYLTMVGLLSLAVGLLVRATAGGIAIMFAAAILAPQLLPAFLPNPLGDWVNTYWPTLAGLKIMLPPGDEGLGPWTGFGVMAACTAVLLAIAYAVFRRRDA